MKEVIPVLWDDLILAEEGTKKPADITVTLAYNGAEIDLDLSTEHANELGSVLARYFDAIRKLRQGKARSPVDSTRTQYNKGLREWANREGLNYRTTTGKYYYSERLKAAYDAYLAGTPWRKVYDGWQMSRSGGS